jgi:hypothetical protein
MIRCDLAIGNKPMLLRAKQLPETQGRIGGLPCVAEGARKQNLDLNNCNPEVSF